MWNIKIYSGVKPDTKEEEYLDKHFKKNGTKTSYWRLEVGGREKGNKDWLIIRRKGVKGSINTGKGLQCQDTRQWPVYTTTL